MVCGKCKNKLGEQNKFCGGCGAPVIKVAEKQGFLKLFIMIPLITAVSISVMFLIWQYLLPNIINQRDDVPPEQFVSEEEQNRISVYEFVEEIAPEYESFPDYIVIRGVEYCTSLTELFLSCWDMPFTNEDITPLRYMENLQFLNIQSGSISDLTPLSNLTNLELLWIDNNPIIDLTPISGLYNLTNVSFRGGFYNDLSPLSSLMNLTYLSLGSREAIELAPLSSLSNLSSLHIYSYEPIDLTPLSDLVNLISFSYVFSDPSYFSSLSTLTNLTSLRLHGNSFEGGFVWIDLTILYNLTRLEDLSIQGFVRIFDLSPLSNLTALEHLFLGISGYIDLQPLSGLNSLTYLWLGNGVVYDLTPLASLINLEHLDISPAEGSDLRPLSELQYLRSLSISRGYISDLAFLSELTDLEGFSIWDSPIDDLSPLSSLTNLTRLQVEYTGVLSDLTPLSDLLLLEELRLRGNKIYDLTPLSQLPNLEELWLEDNPIVDWQPVDHIENVVGRPYDSVFYYKEEIDIITVINERWRELIIQYLLNSENTYSLMFAKEDENPTLVAFVQPSGAMGARASHKMTIAFANDELVMTHIPSGQISYFERENVIFYEMDRSDLLVYNSDGELSNGHSYFLSIGSFLDGELIFYERIVRTREWSEEQERHYRLLTDQEFHDRTPITETEYYEVVGLERGNATLVEWESFIPAKEMIEIILDF